MTKIPLRAYNREIEEAIDQKQFEEAIAHCLHILKTYPKHLGTYRLLGKAYLESQRYGNAADIFQRVLSSIPDDFISHVGMSIIREDEGNLDAAIWHMERAFESQSYNTAIQGELRRLYGQRDGMEPPKIRMTRGALARMYAKSDLYDQAIAELRATLAMDPQRSDLQVLLGKMYAKSGQPADAIEICSSLLQHLPYCLEANRLLTKLLSEGEHLEDIAVYRQRIHDLDPYEAHVSNTMPTAESVPDQAVTIMKIVWDGGPVIPEVADQPEWATAIGVTLEDAETEEEEEALPEWLKEPIEEVQEVEWQAEVEVEEESDEELIPEWMQEAGWEPATGELDESVPSITPDDVGIEGEKEIDEAEAADIPDWLKDIAPEEIPSDEEVLPEDVLPETLVEGLPDWLSEEADGATETIITWLEEKEKSEEVLEEPVIDFDAKEVVSLEDETLDESVIIEEDEVGQLESVEEPSEWTPSVVEEPTQEGAISTAPEDELTDLVEGFELPEDQIPEGIPGTADEPDLEEIPDWLQDLGQEIPMERESSGVTDWLKTLEEEISDQVEEAEPTPIVPQDLTPADVEEPEPSPALLSDDLPQETEEDEEIPDWLLSIKEEAQEAAGDTEPSAAALLEEFPDEPSEVEDEAIPEWLTSLEKESQESRIEAEISKTLPFDKLPEEVSDEQEPLVLPDWLEGFDDSNVEPGLLADIEPEEIPEEIETTEPAEIPEWLQTLGEEAEGPSFESEPTVFVSEDERVEEEVEAISEEIPEWLQGLEEEAEEPEIETEPTSMVPEDEFLGEIAETESDDILEWLEEVEEGVHEPEMETQPTVILPSEPVVEEGVLAESDEIIEWLESLDEGDQEAEMETEPTIVQPAAEKMEDIGISEPDIQEWLEDLTSEEIELPSTEEPDLVTETEIEAEPADIPEWIEGLTGEESELPSAKEPEEIVAEPEVEIPEWITTSEDQEEIELERIDISEVAEGETLPTSEGDFVEEPEFEDADAAMAWLDTLALEDSITDEELLIQPSESIEIADGDLRVEEEKVEEVEVEQIPDFESEKFVTEAEVEGSVESVEADEVVMDVPEPQPDEAESDIVFEDADDALAWLESLAAKQGVSEDELITSPEDRLELPPDWVQQEMAEEMEEGAGEIEGFEGTEPVVEIPDWLKDAIESEDIEALISPDLEAEPQEEPESVGISADLPGFLQEAVELKEEEILEGQPETEPSPMEVAEEIEFEPAPETVPEEVLESYREETIEITEQTEDDYRTIITEDEGKLETVISQEEVIGIPPEVELPPKVELGELEEEVDIEPTELEKEFDKTTDEDYQWVPVEVEEAPTVAPEQLELNEASLKQLERLPSLGFQGAQAIVAYRDEYGPFASLEDLLQVPGISEDTVNAIRSNIIVSPPEELEPEPVTGVLEPTPEVTPSDKFHAIQLEAVAHLSEGNFDDAINKYGQLIKKGKRIDEVIDDLKSVLSGDIPNEVCVDVYQIMGDAYLKSDRLQEALDSYTKAEELLR
jgi:competence ComEA-like helix-hairpin-helix protein